MRFRERVRAAVGEGILWILWLVRALCRSRLLRKWYSVLLAKLIRRTGLFDRDHYLEANGDVAGDRMGPLRHYAGFGDAEGRWPMPLLDPRYYRARATGRTKHVNALLHYAYIGRYRRTSPSPWFDVEYYLAENRDVLRSGIDPLLHYVNWGGVEGRSPTPQFDGAYYLRCHPDVRAARLNPLIHYLKVGRHGQARVSIVPGASEGDGLLTFDAAAWDPLPVTRSDDALVDVVVPVYGEKELTLRCIYRVLKSSVKTPFRLVVIDDCGPEPELAAELERLSVLGLFDLYRNDTNRGFVYSANRGIGCHPTRDVVLLNSDTEVFGDWLDRMRAAAYRDPKTATVTPLSNNATICSYPRFLYDNPYPLEIGYGELDSLAATVNAEAEVEVPTGVGFCMYMRRDAIASVGRFDEAVFGRGYGEENDFCQRAITLGWRNVAIASVFVRHVGGASFQGEKAKRVTAAMRLMQQRHPGYEAAVREFIGNDPMSLARQRLDMARLKRWSREENVLIVCHNRGGGAERHVREDSHLLLNEGKGVFYLRPERGHPRLVRLAHPACHNLSNLPAYVLAETAVLAEVFRELKITRIHSHGLVDFMPEAPAQLLALARSIQAELHVEIHDYKVVCPRINLVGGDGAYCGEPDEEECNRCLGLAGSSFGVTNIRKWRHRHYEVLKAAKRVWVPHEDVATRLARYYPEVQFSVSPHEALSIGNLPRPTLVKASRRKVRIVVLGALSKIKGFEVVLACAKDAKKRRLPLEIVLMGYSFNDVRLRAEGVRVTGRYDDREAQEILVSLAPDAVFLASIWPETYSYTLSLALLCGCDVFAFDLGAIAHRLRELQWPGGLLALNLVNRPAQINDSFVSHYSAQHGAA